MKSLPSTPRRSAHRFLLPFALAALWLGCAQCPLDRLRARPLADLADLQGEVHLQRGDAAPTPAAAGPLFAGDIILTGDASSALVRFRDGREIEVVENGRFHLTEDSGAVTLNLEAGAIISRSGRGGGGGGERVALTILTPFGWSRVPAEGEVEIRVNSEGTAIEVRTGEITFVGKDGKSQKAAAGEKLEVTLGVINLVKPSGEPKEKDKEPEKKEIVLAPIEVTLAAERGAILVKAPDAKRFTPITKASKPVVEGTEWKVGRNARGTLATEGLNLALEGGSSGTIGGSVREGEQRRYGLQLKSGATRLAFSGGGTTLKLSGPTGEVSVSSSERSHATASQTKKGLVVEVHTGTLKLALASGEKDVRAGEVAEISAGEATVKSTGQAPLTLPIGKRTRVFANDLREVALAVPGEGEARVEVAGDASFNAPLMAGRVFGGALTLTPPKTGELHWRVLGEDGAVLRKGQARFEKDSNKSVLDLDNPHSEVADTGQKAVVYFQSVLPSLTFSYPAVEGAQQYKLAVYRVGDLKTAVVEKTADSTRCPVDAGKIGEGEYVWGANALDAAGKEISGGRMNKLEVVYDNEMTTLVIARPRNGEAAGAQVTAKGIAPLGAKLFVNGKSAPLDEKGRFEVRLPRAEQVVFKLVAENGTESYWVRRLKVGR